MPAQSFSSVQVIELIDKKRDLMCISSKQTIGETLELLLNEKLISVPIYGEPNHWISCGGFNLIVDNKQFIGIVSLADLLLFVLKADTTGGQKEAMLQPAYKALGLTNESLSLWAVTSTTPLSQAMELFCKGIHHCLIYTNNHEANTTLRPMKILSQYDIINYFNDSMNNYSILQLIGNKPINLFATIHVITIHISDTMIHALDLLTRCTCIPVLDKQGEIVTNLSLSDLKGHYPLLLTMSNTYTVYEFLNEIYQGELKHPVYVTATEPLRIVIHMMIIHKIHRVWIRQTPSTFKDAVAGVVTMTDVIKAVYDADQTE